MLGWLVSFGVAVYDLYQNSSLELPIADRELRGLMGYSRPFGRSTRSSSSLSLADGESICNDHGIISHQAVTCLMALYWGPYKSILGLTHPFVLSSLRGGTSTLYTVTSGGIKIRPVVYTFVSLLTRLG